MRQSCDRGRPARHSVETLLDRAGAGDESAREQLLVVHRERLRQMVAARLDPRLAARVDPSDIVQETLLDADQRLDDYLRKRPLPFYPWLHRLAGQRLAQVRRWHLTAARDPGRAQHLPFGLPDQSAARVAELLVDPGSSPSSRLNRKEINERVRSALDQLPENDREVLVMHYLDGMRFTEIAAVLDLTPGAVKMRHLRAVERMRHALEPALKDATA